MNGSQERSLQVTVSKAGKIVAGVFLLMAAARCERAGPTQSQAPESTLRVGVAEIEVAPFVQNLTIEGLVKISENGRLTPWLAERWTISDDGLVVSVRLRPNVRFHDGSLLSAELVTDTLRQTLPQFLGAAYEDVASIEPTPDNTIEFKLRRPSSFVLEGLELLLPKPGPPGIGTGPFASIQSNSAAEMRANANYYQGRPLIDNIVVTKYPSVRAAWAEALRDNLDMLYDAGLDARDSLEATSTISVFAYTRHYQYVVLLNPKVPSLRSAAIRRALNSAVDREAFVRDGLAGHGLPSLGAIWPKHWALQGQVPTVPFDPKSATETISKYGERSGQLRERALRFNCLVAAADERMALVLKRQLEAVGVEMSVQEAPVDEISKARVAGNFEAILGETISGPNVYRSYVWWHSKGARNPGVYANSTVDAALDSVRHATSDEGYRAGVLKSQEAILDDPPAIFLAWGERARAVSDRFEVPAQPGVDILGTLRLWRPVAGAARPTSN